MYMYIYIYIYIYIYMYIYNYKMYIYCNVYKGGHVPAACSGVQPWAVRADTSALYFRSSSTTTLSIASTSL